MAKFISLTAALLVSTLPLGCSGGGFSGEGEKKIATSSRDGAATPTPSKPNADATATTSDATDPNVAVIAKCLEKWGPSSPFKKGENFRVINASVSVFGVGNALVDDIQTKTPELVLIGAAVNVLGEATYKLLNNNGWYCLKVDVNVLSTTNLELGCSSHVADSKVDVAVGGTKNRQVGEVGVHVFSDVNVTRAASCN